VVVRPNLAERMMTAARDLQDEPDPQATMQLAARIAATEITGCDAAAVSLLKGGRLVETPASTSETALAGDTLQYALGEGPCLQAVWEERVVVSGDLATESRWRAWSRRMVRDHGVHSMMCLQLFTYADTVGALNLYAYARSAFDVEARDDGLALAAHIAIAVAGAQRIEQLDQALVSRTVIGQATGMLMERYGLTADRAFSLLARVSSQSNVKVRELATELVETRGMISLDAKAGAEAEG
jgi:transcriptional regulator with GAF, ATPase, and Fis domain